MERATLILCVDRDNDLHEKAKVRGPVIGRDANLNAATKLALADPEDPDGNAIFYAIKLYDKLKKEGKHVELATITGNKKLGYDADRTLSRQLDKIVKELHVSSCVLISDGASDEEVIPIVKSRVSIDSTKIIFIKQAKELEKTYFVLLEKLKDPYYARTMIGIPALLILLVSVSSYFGFGWQVVGIIVGLYLVLKLVGVEDFVARVLKDFTFSIERTSWIGYIGGFTLLLVAVLLAYQTAIEGASQSLSGEKLFASVVGRGSTLFVLLVSILLMVIAKSMDAIADNRKFTITKYALYAIAAVLAVLVLKVGSGWILNIEPPYVSFGDFLLALVLAILMGYIGTKVIKEIRIDMLLKMKLDGKEIIDERGTYLGKVIGVNPSEGNLIVLSAFEKKFSLPFTAVSTVTDTIIVKD